MKKKIKRYINGSMVALLLFAFIPSQIIAGTDTNNDSGKMEKKISSNADKISEDILKEPTDTDWTMIDAQDDKNVSRFEERNENARITDSSDTDDITYAFTDTRFQAFVKKLLDLNYNEPITKSACANVESLVVDDYTSFFWEIENVNGIEHFKNLKYLDCSGVYKGSLNVDGFTNLQTLKCSMSKINISGCPVLESLDLYDVSELNVSGCPALESLDLEDNEIGKLNISGCPALKSFPKGLEFWEINISECSGLESLDLKGGRETNKLNISECLALKSLDLYSVSELNVSECLALESLDLYSVSELNVSGCPALESLDLEDSEINKLNISGCPALKSFPKDLKFCEMNMSGCSALESLDLKGGLETNKLNISECLALESLGLKYLQGNNLEVNIRKCDNLQSIKCIECAIKNLDLRNCISLKTLYIDGDFIRGMQPWYISHYYVTQNLDVSGLTNLQTLSCNAVSNLNARGCSNLESLTCQFISNLNLKCCTNLQYLDCNYGEVEKLDLSDCINLQSLKYNCSKTETLDISGYSSLQSLECRGIIGGYLKGAIKHLDVSDCTNLQVLDCSVNQLESLNVSGCISLQSLNCAYNYLKNLDIRGDTSLQSLGCGFNVLEDLNISGCTNIQSLFCIGRQSGLWGYKNNKLKNLNVKGCTNLQSLFCCSNDLESLDLSGCDNLTFLNCAENIMKSPDDVKGRTSKLDEDKFHFYPQRVESNVTVTPTVKPTTVPTQTPTTELTTVPTQTPTTEPTIVPTQTPTIEPTIIPTQTPTVGPNIQPTGQPKPTISATKKKKEQRIFVDSKSLTLYVGGKSTTLQVSKAKGKITYKSSDPNIVKVSEKGRVTPRSSGKTTITIKAAGNSSYKAATIKVKVTVNKQKQKMTVSPGSLTLYTGDKATTLKVSKAKGKITYKSSDPKVVKVSKKGKVIPRSLGNATITIKASGNATYKASISKVKVRVNSR